MNKLKDLMILFFAIIFVLPLISAQPVGEPQNVLTNLTVIQEFSDFVAGDTSSLIFGFDYPDDFNNSDDAPLAVIVNISSLSEDFPVWKGDFILEMTAREYLLPGLFGELFLVDEINMDCKELPPVAFSEIDSEDVVFAIDNIPNGTFYCFNDNYHMLDVGNNYQVTLNVSSDYALYPGNYSISVGLYEVTPEIIDVLDLLALLSSWGECPIEDDCEYDYNNDGIVDVVDLEILLALWGEGPEMFLENIDASEGVLEFQLNVSGIDAVLDFEVNDELFFVNESRVLISERALSAGFYELEIKLTDYLLREKTRGMNVSVISEEFGVQGGGSAGGSGSSGGFTTSGEKEKNSSVPLKTSEEGNLSLTFEENADLYDGKISEDSKGDFFSKLTGAVIGADGSRRLHGVFVFIIALGIFYFVARIRRK